MKNYFHSSPAARVFFLVVSLNIWLGVWLTGFGVAHGWLYLPGGFLLFAAVSGFLPGNGAHALAVQGNLSMSF